MLVVAFAGLSMLPPVAAFMLQAGLMVLFAMLLLKYLFTGGIGSSTSRSTTST